ncbi:MAG: hypothetical protein RL071_1428, partial [Pseudomonadota bacterium]
MRPCHLLVLPFVTLQGCRSPDGEGKTSGGSDTNESQGGGGGSDGGGDSSDPVPPEAYVEESIGLTFVPLSGGTFR